MSKDYRHNLKDVDTFEIKKNKFTHEKKDTELKHILKELVDTGGDISVLSDRQLDLLYKN